MEQQKNMHSFTYLGNSSKLCDISLRKPDCVLLRYKYSSADQLSKKSISKVSGFLCIHIIWFSGVGYFIMSFVTNGDYVGRKFITPETQQWLTDHNYHRVWLVHWSSHHATGDSGSQKRDITLCAQIKLSSVSLRGMSAKIFALKRYDIVESQGQLLGVRESRNDGTL